MGLFPPLLAQRPNPPQCPIMAIGVQAHGGSRLAAALPFGGFLRRASGNFKPLRPLPIFVNVSPAAAHPSGVARTAKP